MSRLNRSAGILVFAAFLLSGMAVSGPLVFAEEGDEPREIKVEVKNVKAKKRADDKGAKDARKQNTDDAEASGVLAADPNHLSAVKALERIRRDEEDTLEGTGFTYRPGDRRDPFMSPQDILKAEMSGRICEGDGIECWLIQDITIIGVLSRGSGNVALVLGPDGYGTTLHEGDRLYDGEVRRIDSSNGLVVFRQQVNDPTRIKPFRDVEKGLNLNKEGRS